MIIYYIIYIYIKKSKGYFQKLYLVKKKKNAYVFSEGLSKLSTLKKSSTIRDGR